MQSRRPPILLILFLLIIALELYHHRYGVMARLHLLNNVKPVGKSILEAGQHLPVMEMTTIGGQRLSIAPKPGHIMYLNVFATWCPECKKEMPALQQLAHETAAMSVDVVGVDQQEDIAPVDAFVAQYGLTYPIFMDDQDLTHLLMGVRYIPTSFIVDSHGVVRARITGALTLAQMEQAVGTVLRGGSIANE